MVTVEDISKRFKEIYESLVHTSYEFTVDQNGNVTSSETQESNEMSDEVKALIESLSQATLEKILELGIALGDSSATRLDVNSVGAGGSEAPVSGGGSGVSDADVINIVNPLLDTKQDELVSGTNIKTVNGSTLLGTGDLTVGTVGSSNSTINNIIKLTQAEYDALGSYDAQTLYIVSG